MQKNEDSPLQDVTVQRKGNSSEKQQKKAKKGTVQTKQGQQPIIQAKQRPIQAKQQTIKAKQQVVQAKQSPVTKSAGIAQAMGKQYGVDTSPLQFNHNSSFPGKVGAEATIQGNKIDFAPGKDSESTIKHEIGHYIVNTQRGTPPVADTVVNGQAVNTTDEKAADKIADTPLQRKVNDSPFGPHQTQMLKQGPVAVDNAPVQGFWPLVVGGVLIAGAIGYAVKKYYDNKNSLTYKITHDLNNVTTEDIHKAPLKERQAILADTNLMDGIKTRADATVLMSALLEGSQKWQNPPGNDFYEYFVTNNGNGTLPNTSTMNCWESIMYAAYLAGVISADYIRQFYTQALNAGGDPNQKIWSQLGFKTSLSQYEKDVTMPAAGQLIFYVGQGAPYPGHVALALGGNKAQSLWSKPNNVYSVQRIEINDLHVPNDTIYFVNPPW